MNFESCGLEVVLGRIGWGQVGRKVEVGMTFPWVRNLTLYRAASSAAFSDLDIRRKMRWPLRYLLVRRCECEDEEQRGRKGKSGEGVSSGRSVGD